MTGGLSLKTDIIEQLHKAGADLNQLMFLATIFCLWWLITDFVMKKMLRKISEYWGKKVNFKGIDVFSLCRIECQLFEKHE